MCSHYQAIRDRANYLKRFGVQPPAGYTVIDMWPGYQGAFIRRPPERDSGDEAVPEREAVLGHWGLIAPWVSDLKTVRSTFNARSETAASKPTFRSAWSKGQRCIVPVDAFYEPDWRSGSSVPTIFRHVDGEPIGIAGLWSTNRLPDGTWLPSFTMLTINADTHPLLRDYHRSGKEKRMVVILPAGVYDDWLEAPVHRTADFMQPFPAEQLVATPVSASASAS